LNESIGRRKTVGSSVLHHRVQECRRDVIQLEPLFEVLDKLFWTEVDEDRERDLECVIELDRRREPHLSSPKGDKRPFVDGAIFV